MRKDKKFILSICGMDKKEMKMVTTEILGTANRYEYHSSSDGIKCG